MLDTRRIALFVVLAFAISGAAAAYLAWSGGLAASPMRTLLVLALWYMPGPALAHLLTRGLTGEGWANLYVRPHLRRGWPWWVAAWFVPPLLVIIGMAFYFAFFPHHFDAEMSQLRAMLDATAASTGTPAPLSVPLYVAIQTLGAMLIAPLVNAPASFGEEFGWRAYLQPKLLPLGWRRAMLWMGLIWGVWHWPIIALGYNYGLDYPGAPWVGMAAFVWFTLMAGSLFGRLTLRGGSVWPAVIAHGALNGMANLPALFVLGEPNPLLGPLVVGLIGGLGFTIVGLWAWLVPPQAVQEG